MEIAAGIIGRAGTGRPRTETFWKTGTIRTAKNVQGIRLFCVCIIIKPGKLGQCSPAVAPFTKALHPPLPCASFSARTTNSHRALIKHRCSEFWVCHGICVNAQQQSFAHTREMESPSPVLQCEIGQDWINGSCFGQCFPWAHDILAGPLGFYGLWQFAASLSLQYYFLCSGFYICPENTHRHKFIWNENVK